MKKFICGGSFRSKVVEKNNEYKIVKLSDNTEIKLLRSSSFTKADKPSLRKIFISPPKLPVTCDSKRISLEPSKEVNL